MKGENHHITQHGLDSFERMYRRYYAALCVYAFDLVNRHELAEEIVQDTFVRIWEKFDEIDISVSEQAYLYRAVHNNCLNFVKQARMRLQYSPEMIQQLESRISLLSVGAGPIEKLHDQQLQQFTATAINQLPPQCRDVFRLSRYEHLSYPEIARELNISVNTVKTQMARALYKLRASLLPLLKK
ncbi:RNA polymerase sigma-70 factor [Chitinophaga pendula]|uniref:RNA polymerase sigma-70 factor n=1 Tax=Chitinophaga TaxID=79328 RepID=UPI000BB05914|nr:MULTISPECIES: RNA polymerase sigma-70 factor [Chitinophaga]ASZ10480.1 RNA polymerase sigma-70 factor [Chitinophaga sp. MD30]UCJ06549.1 RNA polymerase sigma-70 factor [Chitinophaga pendula]